ncbi:Copper amine oxidase N-terminal domain-containing protein [Paenibacillaceae bacterium GAS479]|nr:Copper amine oxidase N-terminal domain-containing protein [Paenibacillaceae bacterium GAS479]
MFHKKRMTAIAVLLIVMLVTPLSAFAHSGRTDSNGGHKCSAKSISKGLCTGYHYHNGGSSSSEDSSDDSSSSSSSSYDYSAPAAPVANVQVTDTGAPYDDTDLSLAVNSKSIPLDKPIVSIQDINYISLRDFAQIFGYTISWDKKTVKVIKAKSVKLTLDTATRKLSNDGKFSGFKAALIDGSYYLPLRYAAGIAKAKISSVENSVIEVSTK